ncbi:hypothetical protein GCM10027034_42660 [Ramlibacter solisilvae]|uniref:Uncharacterized protein n=1 Tax=Ramlibacter tataouinensis TaxID=94132 RepID=A0A127JYR9_9BURK|nr:hypothetical protein [Ramlibacter tataouinensis]AMO23252.1 hypothetical protein UC35_10545 [Ramlibacter tataouinensis]
MIHPELKERSIESIWRAYRDQVLLADGMPPSKVQLTEARRAIYLGCYALLVMMRDDVSNETEEAGMRIMQGMVEEATLFATTALAQGRGGE